MSFRVSNKEVFLLTAGKPVAFETIGIILSEGNSLGQIIDFKVRPDVKVGDKVVNPADSIAKGQIN
jgi:hypothetical protein